MRSISLRLLLPLSAVVVLIFGVMAYMSSRSMTSEFERYVEEDFLSYEQLITPFIIQKMENFLKFRRLDCDQSFENWLDCQSHPIPYTTEILTDFQSLVNQLSEFSGTRIIVADSDGRVLANSEGNRQNNDQSLNLSEASGVLVIDRQLFLVHIDLTDASGIGASQRAFINSVNRSLVATVVLAGIAAIGLGVLLSRRILNPIGALTAAARQMELGDLSQRVAIRSQDEIGELAQAFNAMADGLSRLEQLQRNMVSDIAHELRTPLSNVRGYLEAIQDGLARADVETIDSLHEEVMLLNRLVDDLQELALAEAGKLQLQTIPISLREIVLKAQKALEPKVREKDIAIHLDIPDALPPLEVDPERIGQVLRNLLANAVEYTPQGGEIRVVARAGQEGIEVKVCDSGIGIAEEHLSFLFERFYRVDGSRTRSTGGAGLGLAIVKQLVQAHGGKIEVDSILGSGTTITFTLPMSVPS